MKLSETHLAKIDFLLRDALENADGNEILRCVMLLGTEEAEHQVVDQDLDPSQFSSRQAYRQALITQRQEVLARQLGQTLQILQALSLVPRGGQISPTVVVEGSAGQIWAALALPDVRHATESKLFNGRKCVARIRAAFLCCHKRNIISRYDISLLKKTPAIFWEKPC